MSKAKDLTTGKPISLMIKYAIPVLIGNLVQQIYNFADTIIVGQCLGNSTLAAGGNTGSMFFLVNGFVIGITSGFSVHIAQCFGAKDYDRMRNSVCNAIMLWSGITLFITLLSVLITKPVLRLINTPDGIFDMSYNYIVIIFAGIAAPMLYNAVSCILRALGDSKTPLYFLIFSALLNIGLDLLFIVVFKWGVAGAAIATVLAQLVAGIACIVYISVKFPVLHIKKEDFKINPGIIKTHLTIGLPMAFQFSVTAIGTIILQGAVNVFGENYIAAFTASSKTEQLIMQFGISGGVTVANFVGQNVGAGRYDRIKNGILKWSLFTVGSAVLCMGVIFIFGRPISRLFIKGGDELILSYAMTYLHISMFFYIPLFQIFIFRNALQAMGKTTMPLLAGFFELGARSIVAYTLPKAIGFSGVCFAGPVAWVCAAVPLIITYIIYMKKFKKKGYFNTQFS